MKIIAQYMRTDDTEAVGATYDYFAAKIVPKKPYPSLKGIKALWILRRRMDLKLRAPLQSALRTRLF